MAGSGWRGVLGRVVEVAVREAARSATAASRAPRRAGRTRPVPPSTAAPGGVTEYDGPLEPSYDPHPDADPDPGEVVWAWVPFEEGDGRGKDRPVLVVGRDGAALLALMMTSKDHDRDAEDEARHGRYWVDVGSGPWDRQGRPSEVRVDRVLRVHPGDVRRAGATLDRARFEEVAAGVRGVRR